MKRRYIKLPPELVDGQHWTATANSQDIGDAVIRWALGFMNAMDRMGKSNG